MSYLLLVVPLCFSNVGYILIHLKGNIFGSDLLPVQNKDAFHLTDKECFVSCNAIDLFCRSSWLEIICWDNVPLVYDDSELTRMKFFIV